MSLTLGSAEPSVIVWPKGQLARVLIVEDDPDLRAALRLRLEAEHMHVRVESDGRRALDVILATRPDVVILDLGLPGIDGFDLLDRLHRLCDSGTRFLVLSAWDRHRCEAMTLARGASLYLEKPVAFEELLAAVRYLLDDRA